MILAILLISIFNLGLNVILIGGAVGVIKDYVEKAIRSINNNTNSGVEAIGTAIFNMDSIKQKVKTSGKFEL